MGIENFVCCDDCKVFAWVGEYLFTKDTFQKTRTLWRFLVQHREHRISIYEDVEDTDKDLTYKEIELDDFHWDLFNDIPPDEEDSEF